MLKKLSAAVICLLVMMFAVPSQAKLGNPERMAADNFVLLERIFKESGAELQEIKLKHWGQISNKSQTLPELETKYLVLVKRLGLDPEQRTIQIDRDGLISISQLEAAAGQTIQIFLQYVPQPNNTGLSHWGIAIQVDNLERADRYYHLMKTALRELGSLAEPRLELWGIIPCSMSAEPREVFMQHLTELARAQFVEGAVDGHLTSRSFYTQEANGAIVVGGRQINLNLALREIPSLNQTNLYIGMPLLFSDY